MKSTADRLEEEVVALSCRMSAAEYQFLTRVRELEDCIALEDWTYPKWLAWRCNMSNKAAYERVRVARAIADLPAISEAFCEGRLSYSKVRVLTRVATAATDTEYLKYALVMSVHQLETLVTKQRRVSTDDATVHEENRYLQLAENDDGMFAIRGLLSRDDAAILLKGLRAAETAGAQSKLDALLDLTIAGIDRLAVGDDLVLHVETQHVMTQHVATPTPANAGDTPSGIATPPPHQHCCTGESHSLDGIAIAPATAARLRCENPNKRTMTTSQRRILVTQQSGCCAFPGCTHVRHLQGHHIIPWAEGGRTTIDNLCLICTKHHRLLHEGRFTLERKNGQLIVRHRHGYIIEHAPRQPVVPEPHRDLETTVPAKTDTRGGDLWSGDRVSWKGWHYGPGH